MTEPAKVVNVKKSLDIDRQQLPQITSKSLPHFVKFLTWKGVPVEQITKRVFEIKPTQKELNAEKVKKFVENPDLDDGSPFIISRTNRLLDGHHRWAAQYQKDSDADVDVVRVGANMERLIELGNEFNRMFFGAEKHKTIDESALQEMSSQGISSSTQLAARVGYEGKPDEFRKGLTQEMIDSGEMVGGDLVRLGEIVKARLLLHPDYYSRLKR